MVTVIRELRLDHFKTFDRFTLGLAKSSFVVGPNNAGKSTLTGAIRVAAQMVRLAHQRNPDRACDDAGTSFVGYSLPTERFGLPEPVFRHEFRRLETRLRVTFHDRATVTGVWPVSESDDEDADEDADGAPFFYLRDPDGRQPHRAGEVRRGFPGIGIIPVLSPVDIAESVLSSEHVRSNSDTRLASRHFRNHMWMLRNGDWPGTGDNAYGAFLEFAREWTPEIVIRDLETRGVVGEGQSLELWYSDRGRNAYKELAWIGDGMQIWLQILLHVFRLRGERTIVLDEPDVYLHADLQRRLVRLLESLPAQTVVTTHSAEILGEAATDSIIWVDRSKRKSVRAKDPEILSTAADALGSQFNLRVAKAMRVGTALFVEGNDMRVLSQLARTVGADSVADEAGIAVIPLGGFSRWEHAEAFAWLSKDLLGGAMRVTVILDRDYRTDAAIAQVEQRLGASDIDCHVWSRKELESYLLHPAAIARCSGLDEVIAAGALADAVAEQEQHVRSRLTSFALEEGRKNRDQESVVLERIGREFEQRWLDPEQRIALVPAKDVLTSINRRMGLLGGKPMSQRSLAKSLRVEEIPHEMVHVLREINGQL